MATLNLKGRDVRGQARDEKEAKRMTKSLARLLSPPTSCYAAIIKKPTGKNGFEEYLRCVDAVRAPEVSKYASAIYSLAYNEKAPSADKMTIPKWAAGRTVFDLRREETKRFEKLLDLIAEGNRKPVQDPTIATMTSPEHAALVFPVYTGFKNITRLASDVAEVHISDGHTAGAVTRLIDQLNFSQKVRRLGVLSDLVGVAMDGVVCRVLERHLADFQGADWDSLIAFAREDLKNAPPLRHCLELKEPSVLKAISESEGLAKEAPTKPSEDEEEPMKSIDKLATDLHGLSEKDRKRTIKEAVAYARERYNADEARLLEPESRWPWPGDKIAPPPSALIGELCDDIPPPEEFRAEAKSRIVMRLIVVHGLIQEYRISKGHLPVSLSDLNSPADIKDPLVGGTFKYEPSGKTYRLYSPGKGVMYPIELTTKPGLYPKIEAQMNHGN